MKILIADDLAQNRYMLEQLLTASGHRCVSVANGRDGLERLRAEGFDVVVSDILMPVMDGFQFCREVKSDTALRAVPFLFYTATYTGPADIEFGLQLGAAAYLIKPAEPEAILAALNNLAAPATTPPPPADPADYLAQYNARLVQKLESKMHELERANAELLRTNLALSEEVGRRRAAERSARAASALQHATLESTADGILAVDARGRIVAWNRSFAELWGLPATELPTTSFSSLVASLCAQAADPGACALAWRERASGGDSAGPETIWLADGRVFERLSRPLAGDDAGPGRVWTFRDVTERHQAEAHGRALQSQLFELQKMESLGVLAGGVAHDFNNILTAIIGQTSLALSQLDQPQQAQPALAAVLKASERATDLVRQILAFSRRQEPIRQVFAVTDIVTDALKLAGPTLPAGIQLSVDLAPDVPDVRVDATQMHQVLMNLVTNANHAMKGQGQIRVTARRATVAEDSAVEVRPGCYAILSVGDTGPGIEPRLQRRIFEPFFTTKPAGQGTGLGLAVVHGIVTSYGGHVEVRSSPGAGAEFLLYLPAADCDAKELKPAPAGALLLGAGQTILVAEDDRQVRDLVEAVLVKIGYHPVVCPSAEAALLKFSTAPGTFAALLTDLSMGGMSGISLARKVRQQRPRLPVVLMTGYLSFEEFDEEQPDKDFELLMKPCSPQSLSVALARALQAAP
ncbi:MAG: response regulator [Opitutae bacterium]|nr:response regulator [Opitutae bacterium]